MSDHALPNILLNDFSGDNLLKLPTNFYKSAKSYLDNKSIKKVQKAYEKAMDQAEEALKKGAALEKEFGIPPIKY